VETTYTQFYCCSEWHFARLHGRGSNIAPLVYTIALNFSKNTGVFNIAAGNLAEFLGVDVKNVQRAYQHLVRLGFFEVLRRERGTSVKYRVLKHRDWKAKHPGCCAERVEMPWDDEEKDQLGQRLYGVSGGRYRTYTNFLKGMRNTGHNDEAICALFREFIDIEQPTGKQWRNGFSGRFMKFLRSNPPAERAAAANA
jgi:hypothetical protein